MHQLFGQQTSAYAWLMAAGILVSAVWWFRRSKDEPALLIVYLGALGGAFAGAKLAYVFAEGWLDFGREDMWLRLATGKSVLGGLLGGYAGVEIMKRLVGHKKPTGDAFSLILPIGLLLGRMGCVLHGCCLGKPVPENFLLSLRDRAGHTRWPAAPAEMVFLALMFLLILFWRRQGQFRDRLFFVFLIAYGAFRFFHEWLRDTPKWGGLVSGYQVIALAMAMLGWVMFVRRGRAQAAGGADG